jgi:hypothetical protein
VRGHGARSQPATSLSSGRKSTWRVVSRLKIHRFPG